MNTEYEEHYHLVEERHWWFAARRHAVHGLVTRANTDPACRILEIGCSAGPLIQVLRSVGYRHISGIDISEKAISLCHARGIPETQVMDAQRPDFPDRSFDVITASDVLEHLEDDRGALREWHRLLRPGGTVIVFVPAYRFLWSAHDVVNRHFRRYRRSELVQRMEEAGFEVIRSSYWNFAMFVPVAVVRLARRILRVTEVGESGDIGEPSPFLNRLLLGWLRIENALLLRGMRFPWGVSAMVIARRKGGT